jgi:hypothetical protein
MSLETEIAALTSKATSLLDYFGNAKASIANALAAAVAAAPEISRTFYVDQAAGDDLAAGTLAAPMKTINRAVASTPSGGVCDVILLKDYTLDVTLNVRNRHLMIRGDSSDTNTRKLIINEFLSSTGTRMIGSFQVGSSVSLGFADLTLSLPNMALSNGALDTYCALIYAGGQTIPGFFPVKLYKVGFDLRGTFSAKIVGVGLPVLSLTAVNTTIPSALEGSLISGVSAGKDPNTIPYLLTNIAKL